MVIQYFLLIFSNRTFIATIVTEEGCHNKNDESYPELEVTVAALSGGPVGPSDRYDLFNKT